MRVLALLLALFLGVSAGVAQGGEVKIAWYGQSMFLIETPKGKRIIIDPHNIEEYRIKDRFEKGIRTDLLLMSHFHTDHTQEDVIENVKDIPKRNALKKGGFEGSVIDWNVVDEKHFNNEVRIQTLTVELPSGKHVGTYHDEKNGLDRGKNGVWIITIDGEFRIAHLGDLGHQLTDKQLKKLGAVDVLMVPAGGVYTINGITAFKVMQQVKARRTTIPMHYGTIVYGGVLPLSYFTDECKEENVKVNRMKSGWLKLDTKAPLPKEPEVTVMDHNGVVDFKLKGK